MIDNSGLVSVRTVLGHSYPGEEYWFSPSSDFPDLPFAHRATSDNPVYDAVRQCMLDNNLDSAHAGSREWNPLSSFTGKGGKVFVLCNFVYERRPLEKPGWFEGKCTHASVIRPVIDYALKAVGPEGKVFFGNAPLQSADWSRLMKETGSEKLLEFYDRHAPGQVKACDLRSFIISQSIIGAEKNKPWKSSIAPVEVDLGDQSLLSELKGNRHYRIANYNHKDIERYHNGGSNKYLLNRHILDSDLIISIPKLKTHCKVGVTLSIKGCVGAIELKQCLAHHQKGSFSCGGDEYEKHGVVGALLSAVDDWTYSRESSAIKDAGLIFERLINGVNNRLLKQVSFGSWEGNDTCWRMAVDIARCVTHASKTGELLDAPQRKHVVFTDGIIGGEGEGPLDPRPVKSGFLSFASDCYAADYVSCTAMGFNPEKFPIISSLPGLNRYPLTGLTAKEIKVSVNGRLESPGAIRNVAGKRFSPPLFWKKGCLA